MVLSISGFPNVPHPQYANLRLAPQRAVVEQHTGLLYALAQHHAARIKRVVLHTHTTANCVFGQAMLAHYDLVHTSSYLEPHDVMYIMPDEQMPVCYHGTCAFVLAPSTVDLLPRFHPYPWSGKDYTLHVRLDCVDVFEAGFGSQCVTDGVLEFDNLINMCIMVKNAGPLFRQVLQHNMRYADRWTVLDTGSTDDTVVVVRDVLGSKLPGTLVEEPFLNFRDSRNRCLDLAGKHCKYNIMLDDTYLLHGDIRRFLSTVRADEFGSSYSLYIRSDDTEYTTNRITRSELGLRYKFKIHEVITDEGNVNVLVPREVGWIEDLRAEYMEQRTLLRKQYDLQLLLQSIEEEPEEPRHLYYAAQTYSILNDFENTAKYFQLRADHPGGFYQERVDAAFELARTLQFKLNRPWSQVESVYLKVLELEPRRVDAMYFLGLHHVYDGRHDENAAFPWFEQAFHLGYSTETQYSLKPTLVFYFLPNFLVPLCYTRNKWQLGYDAAQRLLTNLHDTVIQKVAEAAQVQLMTHWRDIYSSLLKLPAQLTPLRHIDVLFVVDGNWSAWTGADIEVKGLGGSETWAVEVATTWARLHPNQSIVFLCKCASAAKYRGVEFLPVTQYEALLATHTVGTCIVSRFSHYLFAPLHTRCEQLVLYLHDIAPTGNILPIATKLTHIFCLSPWHQQLVQRNFPSHAARTHSHGYGIDSSRWAPGIKRKHSFIYSSFPDRGLLHLLRMWPRVRELLPDATLHVFCNLQHQHVRTVNGPMMHMIDQLLAEPGWCDGVTVHGWVSKAELSAAFASAEYWLYPNIFDETFCLTALEALSCGVVGIAPPKAALQHMPLYFVHGDASTQEWQAGALEAVAWLTSDAELRARYQHEGLQFARERSWERQTEELAKLVFVKA